jgi:DNA-binding transcriptional ArsR family regulator
MNVDSYSCCTPKSADSVRVTKLTELLKVVSEESRLKLLCILRRGKHCVCELSTHAHLSKSLISHHLRDLKEAGIVSHNKQGLRVYYALTNKGKRVTDSVLSLIGKKE